jgi:hypothetical protein
LARGTRRCYLVAARLAALAQPRVHDTSAPHERMAVRPISTVAVGVCVAQREEVSPPRTCSPSVPCPARRGYQECSWFTLVLCEILQLHYAEARVSRLAPAGQVFSSDTPRNERCRQGELRWRLTAVGASALAPHAHPAASVTISTAEARAMLAARFQGTVRRDGLQPGCCYVRVQGAAAVLPAWAVLRDGATWLAATLSAEEGERLGASLE